MANVNEWIELQKKEQELIIRLANLEQRSKELQNQTDKSNEHQAIEEQKASVQSQLATTRSEMNEKINEIAKEALSKTDEQKQNLDIKPGRGDFDPNEIAKTQITREQEDRQRNIDVVQKIAKTNMEVGISTDHSITPKDLNAATLDATLLFVGVGVGANKIIEYGKEKFSDNAVNDLDKNIANNEKYVNEKFNKEILDIEKYRQSQIAYTEKKNQNTDEKNKTIEKINDTADKMKDSINKERETDPNVKQAEAERKLFNDTLEKTKNLDFLEKQQEMEKVRQEIEKQRQLELERQRQLAEQNRNR